ncbi:MAG: hypothetical protein ACM31D_15475 [Bacteroidota bacterium]
MTASTLTLEGFRELLDRFGGELSRWPARERATADALLEHSPEARSLLAEAARLDAALAATPKAPAGLADRIVAAALAQDRARKN